MNIAVPGIDGKPLTFLNDELVKRQGLTENQINALILSHQIRWMLFESAKNITEPLKLKMLANIFTALEFEQQKLWNFPPDLNFHRFFDFPGCICPKYDNIDTLGTSYKIYAQNCPIHGESK